MTIAFDRSYAQSLGINLWAFDQLFLVALALAIVISLQTVGNVLVLAMLVTPAATARMLTDRLKVMIGAVGRDRDGQRHRRALPLVLPGHSVRRGGGARRDRRLLAVFLFAPNAGAITSRVLRRLHHGHPERDQFPDEALPA